MIKTKMTKEIIAPCKDCENRHFKCHGECEEYEKYKENSAIRKKEKDDILFSNKQYEDYLRNRLSKSYDIKRKQCKSKNRVNLI